MKNEFVEIKQLFCYSSLAAIPGTIVAAMHHMDGKGLYAIVAGLLAAAAAPAAGAPDLLLEVASWIADSRIAEIVAAANALTIVP